MSTPTDTLRELARLLNAREPVDVTRFFTEDFRLDDPGAGVTRIGHAGAQLMIDAVLAFAPGMRLEILDMFEQGDRGAVRWQVATGAPEGGPAMLAILPVRRQPHRARLGHLGGEALAVRVTAAAARRCSSLRQGHRGIR
jgi:hypothetical protein